MNGNVPSITVPFAKGFAVSDWLVRIEAVVVQPENSAIFGPKKQDMTTRKKPFPNVDEYVRSFPPNVQKILEELRRTVQKAAPTAEEAMSYGIPTFKLNGNLVHFAAYKNHIGFYPTPSAIGAFQKELSPYRQAKGSVQFPIDESIPFSLVGEIVEYRVKENLGGGKKRK